LASYVFRRILIGLVQAAGITLVVFFVIRALPADPVARLVGFNSTEDVYNQAKASLGLDRTVSEQLGDFVGTDGSGVVTGDLGTSWVTGSSVTSEIITTLPITLQLVVLSFVLAMAVAIPVGVATAKRPGGKLDKSVFGYGLFAGAQPEFWWALMFSFFFYFKLGIAPAPLGVLDPLMVAPEKVTGFILIDSLITGRFDAFFNALWHLWLPVMTLAFILSGPIIKMTRQSMARVLSSEFILYSRASGLSRKQIARSTLRASLPPVLTLTGILFGFMLGGAVLIEQVFSLNGLGSYSVRAVLNLDYPAIQGTVLVITLISLIVYLILDLVLVFTDPRVKAQ
jgi:ABC-type dipeptide/oligopeptide/nickel transport system permease component